MSQSSTGPSPKQPGSGGFFPRTKEGYREFLKTEFWRELRDSKFKLNPKCEFPGCSQWANAAHHVFYRPNWEDARITDLISVCDAHHQQIHHIQKPAPPPSYADVEAAKAKLFAEMNERINKRFDRAERARRKAVKRLRRWGNGDGANVRW